MLVLTTLFYGQLAFGENEKEAKEVTIRKNFGNTYLEMFCGILAPYKIKFPDPLILIIENKKGYTTQISYVRLRLKSGKKSLYIEAKNGFANKDYSKIELKGVIKVENKGFSLPYKATNLIILLSKNKVFIDRAG